MPSLCRRDPPQEVGKMNDKKLDDVIHKMRQLIRVLGDHCVGIGEIGLDYTVKKTSWANQRRGLKRILVKLRDLVRNKVVVTGTTLEG